MKKCPYCAEEIQDEAIVCKHCGRDIPPVKQKKKTPLWMYIVVTILFVCFCVTAIMSGGDGEEATPVETETPEVTQAPSPTAEPTATKDPNKLDEYEATHFALLSQDYVLQALKAPSTAEFPSIYWGNIWIDYRFLKKNGIVTVQSWVDAENSFGAKLRSNYTAQFD